MEKRLSGDVFVYFDLGGVMLDFSGALVELSRLTGSTLEICRSIWSQYDSEVCLGRMSVPQLWQAFRQSTGYSGPDINLLQFWVDHFQPHLTSHTLARQLASDYRVGLFSNVYPEVLDLSIATGKVPDLPYSAVIQSCQAGLVKPDDRIFDLAQQAAGVVPEQIVFIDDSEVNIQAAVKRGWRGVLFNSFQLGESAIAVRQAVDDAAGNLG